MHSIRFVVPAALLIMLFGLAAAQAAPAPPASVTAADRPSDDGLALVLTIAKSPDDTTGGSVTSYKVYQRLSGQPFAQVGEVTATHAASYTYVLSGLTPGVLYGVGVSASDGSSESTKAGAWGTPVDNTPPRPPRNVTVVDVAGDNGRALLVRFDASLDDTATDKEVTEYRVFRSTVSTDPGGQIGTVPAVQSISYSYRDGTVLPGRRYYYRLCSAAGTGVSALTTAVSGVPVDNRPPGAPTPVTLTDRAADDGTALLLTFGRSPDDGGGAGDVIRYHVYQRLPRQPVAKVAEITATGQATYVYTAGSLTCGQQYGLGVAAYDGTSLSAYTIYWKAPVDNTPPQPPTNLQVADIPGDNGRALLVKWSASVDDTTADPEVAAYQVFRSTVADQNGTQVGSVTADRRTALYTYRDATVLPGHTYYYRLRASAPTGLSAFTPPVTGSPVDNNPPQPPANVTVADRPSDDGVALLVNFDKSPDDGAGANDVVAYHVYRRVSGGPLEKIGEVPAAARSMYQYVAMGLTPGTAYGMAVASFDGTSESTKTVYWKTPIDNTAPRPPTGLAVEDWPDDDGASLKISFAASPDDVTTDREVTRYDIYRATTATGTGAKIGQLTAIQAATYQFRNMGLTSGQTYWFWAIAVGATGSSVPSNKASGAPLDNRPVRPPLNLTAADRPYDNGGVIDLAWDRSGDDGVGLNHVAKYNVYRRQANLSSDTPVLIGTVTATDSAHYNWSDTTVPMQLVLYQYTVTAASASNVESVPAGPATAASADNNVVVFFPPTNLVAADYPNDYGGQIQLTWNRSASENDPGWPPPPPLSPSQVTTQDTFGGRYEFYRRTSTGTYTTLPTFSVSAAGDGSPMSYVDTGLTNGVAYYYKVRYRRYDQISEFTPEAHATPANNRSTSAGASSPTGDSTPDAGAATLGVRLIDAPQTVTVGRNVDLAVSVTGDGPSSVCLQYSINGCMASRTASVSSTDSYGTQLRLNTSHLSPGDTVKVCAVVTQGTTCAVSAAVTMTMASP